MKQVCLLCERTSPDGNLYCQETYCPAEMSPIVLDYGEWFGDIEIVRSLVVLRSAAIYEVMHQKQRKYMKVAHPGAENKERLKREAEFLAGLATGKDRQDSLPTLLPPYAGTTVKQDPYGKTMLHGHLLYFYLFEFKPGDTLREVLVKNPQLWVNHVGWITIEAAASHQYHASARGVSLRPDTGVYVGPFRREAKHSPGLTSGLHFVVAFTPEAGTSDLRRRVLSFNYELGLQTAQAVDVLKVSRIPAGVRDRSLPVGRGYLVNSGQPVLIQVASPYDGMVDNAGLSGWRADNDLESEAGRVAQALDAWVERIKVRYGDAKAAWSGGATVAEPVRTGQPSARANQMLRLVQRALRVETQQASTTGGVSQVVNEYRQGGQGPFTQQTYDFISQDLRNHPLLPGQRVVLMGHSGGGAVVANLAGELERNLGVDVGGIVTLGSPVSNYDLASRYAEQIIQVRHQSDFVGIPVIRTDEGHGLAPWQWDQIFLTEIMRRDAGDRPNVSQVRLDNPVNGVVEAHGSYMNSLDLLAALNRQFPEMNLDVQSVRR